MDRSEVRLSLVVAVTTVISISTACTSTYSYEYRGVGDVATASVWSKSASDRLELIRSSADPTIDQGIKIFVDTVPPEVIISGDVISANAALGAQLIGRVRVRPAAVIAAPKVEEALPMLREVVQAGNADLAYCPLDRRTGWYDCVLFSLLPIERNQPAHNAL